MKIKTKISVAIEKDGYSDCWSQNVLGMVPTNVKTSGDFLLNSTVLEISGTKEEILYKYLVNCAATCLLALEGGLNEESFKKLDATVNKILNK